jgi:hypothetical protein
MGKGAAVNAGTTAVRVLEEVVTVEEIFDEVRGRVLRCCGSARTCLLWRRR